MIYPENKLAALYEDIATFVNYSERRYSLTEIYKMIPWEFLLYMVKYSEYVDKIKKG